MFSSESSFFGSGDDVFNELLLGSVGNIKIVAIKPLKQRTYYVIFQDRTSKPTE
jgi:hypothetical protein